MTNHNVTYSERASWLEINTTALEQNIQTYRRYLKQTKMGCVLKGNAYGHGLQEMLPLIHSHADAIFVIDPCDALWIRQYEKETGKPSQRLIVLGAVGPQETLECARNFIEVAVGGADFQNCVGELRKAQENSSSTPPLKVHIHLDTGLARDGFSLDQLPQEIAFFKECTGLIQVTGVMSHFANVEDVTNQDYAYDQLKAFEELTKVVEQTLSLPYHLEKHFAQSAASFLLPESHYHIARVGISLYGLWSSKETRLSAKLALNELPQLMPILAWRCQSQCIKEIPAGNYVGYGCSHRADRRTRIAVFPVGYFDGYARIMSQRAYVLVQGKRCKVIGRIMMNHIIVDITEIHGEPTSVTATLMGNDGSESITAETLAEWAQTINYEIVTRIGAHLKRKISS